MSSRLDQLADHAALHAGGPALGAWPTGRHARLRPGKGGGGGSKAAARMEAERQARVSAAVNEINSIFNGDARLVGANQASIYDPNRSYYTADGRAYTAPTKQVQTGFDMQWREGGGDAGERYQAKVPRYETQVDSDAVLEAIRKGLLFETVQRTQKQDRNQMYDEQRQAVTDINSREVNRQFEDASRANRFGLARAGLSGGSADIDSHGELARRQNEGLIQAAGIGDTAAADLRNQDERTRQNLISMAQSGIDTGQAAQLALTGLDANAKSAMGVRSAATVNRLFDDLSNAYLYRQQMQGMQNGMAPYRNRDQYGASNIRSGGDAGRVV